ncbi:helix-turn-helix domain-containing protein [Enterococcus faecium]|uniref:helix-turn-helix domain-containing protein n=1 Tax=Enterococcus faecium TaxID=1352 RepID=UPI0003083BBB|nr:helix-turn-helix transcriptional regulator [Enterococcus faecium]HAQ1366322.1 helix-turn-helix transcriptional regulator [Enterococcus faecium Ef_RPH2]HAQ1383422.1 helix-turn-helix transcriptional regulator [Enterococcus faecium Ef_aus0081]HAQ1390071.1 helix-turn-helix transcriptional regulator [Enterococcus faecium Ef_aus0087]HAQ1581977.1 helix-turn-helix transcriptional regulator [Enterococcus faecium Efm-HS0661]AWV58823.1 XRE family transcriptional regulator [Enterococcus faecium]
MHMHIGEKIYKLRRLNNETMNDLVKQTGVSKSWLSDIESGKKQRVDFNKICAIAKHYKVSLEYFRDDYLDSDEHEDIIPLTGETRVKSVKSLEQSLKYLNNKQEPNLLEIKLKDTDSVPEVWYKGERLDELPKGLVDVSYHWKTDDFTNDDRGANDITIQYFSSFNDKYPDKKTIGHKRDM